MWHWEDRQHLPRRGKHLGCCVRVTSGVQSSNDIHVTRHGGPFRRQEWLLRSPRIVCPFFPSHRGHVTPPQTPVEGGTCHISHILRRLIGCERLYLRPACKLTMVKAVVSKLFLFFNSTTSKNPNIFCPFIFNVEFKVRNIDHTFQYCRGKFIF